MSEKNAKEIQRAIVGIITSQGNLTVADIAKRLGLRPHMARYHLDQLLQSKRVELSRMLNYRVFGWQIINVFFDLPRATKKRGLDFLAKRPEVFWLAQNVGPRGLEITFFAEGFADFAALLNDFGESADVHFRDPIVSHESEARHWGLRFLADKFSREPATYFTYPDKVQDLDPVDRKILYVLRYVRGASVRDVSKAVGIAQTTATYRLERLRDWGAISDDIYFGRVDHEFVQAQVVLNLKARGKRHDQAIVDICSKEPYVEGLITGLGCWDYKIILRADTVQRLIEIEESILAALGKNVARTAMYVRNRIFSAHRG